MSKEMENKVPENQHPDQQMNPAGKNDSNIQLTVLRPRGDNGEMSLDLYEIGAGLKRFLALWLALAVACGAITVGIAALLRHTVYGGDARAIIEFSLSELRETVEDEDEAKAGRERAAAVIAADINRMQTGAIIEQAMRNVGVGVQHLDAVRNGLTIESVMSSDTYNKQSLYYKLIGNNANQEMMDTLLGKNDPSLRYMVSLNYEKIEIDRETAVRLLDEIILCYRQDFENSNNVWTMPGSSVKAVDYKAYDYAEGIAVFRNQLDGMKEWIQNNILLRTIGAEAVSDGSTFNEILSRNAEKLMSDYRASSSGYTLRDLYDREELLRNTDLNSAASFINMKSVTAKDAAAQISYYKWLIDNLSQTRTTIQAQYNSLRSSVANYKKDPVVFTGADLASENGRNEKKDQEEIDAYDSMILQMVDLQERIVKYSTSIRYYESLVARMEQEAATDQESRNTADVLMANVSTRMEALSAAMNDTMQEYQKEAVKDNAVNILVPAVAHAPGLMDGPWMMLVVGVEAVLFLGWLVAGIGYGMKQANPRKKKPAGKETAAA